MYADPLPLCNMLAIGLWELHTTSGGSIVGRLHALEMINTSGGSIVGRLHALEIINTSGTFINTIQFFKGMAIPHGVL